MNTSQKSIGWERKIGYSFVGLMAGNGASVLFFLIIPLVPRFQSLWWLTVQKTAWMSLLFAVFSLPEWVVLGLPLVLLLRSEIVADFYWATAALIGTVLGVIGMLLFTLTLDRGFSTLSNPAALRQIALIFVPGTIVAAVAFPVYCSLMKAALKRQAKESGVSKGTPRAIPWFGI